MTVLGSARIRIRPFDPNASGGASVNTTESGGAHHHAHAAPEPVAVHGKLAAGNLEIVATPAGERMRFSATQMAPNLEAEVVIYRDNPSAHTEVLALTEVLNAAQLQSTVAPAEPHEFAAVLRLRSGGLPRSWPSACTNRAFTLKTSVIGRFLVDRNKSLELRIDDDMGHRCCT